jgi:hypothetical protein
MLTAGSYYISNTTNRFLFVMFQVKKKPKVLTE